MGEKIQVNVEDIERDLEDYIKNFNAAFCSKLADEMTEYANNLIRGFYGSYTPKFYDRTRNFLKNSVERYYHNNGRKIEAGVRIGATDDASPYVSGTHEREANDVFQYTFQGLRSPAPSYDNIAELLQEKIKSDSFKKELQSYAEGVANKAKYRIIQII